MKLNDIYESRIIRFYYGSNAINDLQESRFMSEISDLEIDYERADRDQRRLKTHVHFDPYIDGDRVCTISSHWFDDRPFMVTRSGGRGGQDEASEFITDKEIYNEVVKYCLQFKEEESDLFQIHDPNIEMSILDEFYSFDISLENFGLIPKITKSFLKDLDRYNSENAWPYCRRKRDPDNPITLKEKKEIRWKRFGEDFKWSMKDISVFAPIKEIYEDETICRDSRVKKMKEFLEELLKDSERLNFPVTKESKYG